jgi:hypothetical protein
MLISKARYRSYGPSSDLVIDPHHCHPGGFLSSDRMHLFRPFPAVRGILWESRQALYSLLWTDLDEYRSLHFTTTCYHTSLCTTTSIAPVHYPWKHVRFKPSLSLPSPSLPPCLFPLSLTFLLPRLRPKVGLWRHLA